ncbi:unnamed protein product [Ceutorhynchus assimilis]|uniref:Peptidase S1 domain-containing protein n=1 Tax=Ceutorhynchus assimilis TaxID=467358 RepID=A0A9N9Q9M1_9CUCU|nr:unnamed protein product [Ceutorhynchus assimilis]
MDAFHIFAFAFSLCFVSVFASTRIVNGTDALEGEFPFAVSLRHNSRHTCGGTILNEKYILSAAHCVCNDKRYGFEPFGWLFSPRNSSAYSIQYGLNEITTEATNVVNVKKINCHNFDSDKLIFDCAVLELESPLPDDGSWKPVTISKDFDTKSPQTGIIIGWGKTAQDAPLSRKLQKLQVDIFDDETCAAAMDNTHHICFGAMNGGACNGDSGTALLVDNQQVGIASFITNKCGIATKKHPNVYSRVPTYFDWISNIMARQDKEEKQDEEARRQQEKQDEEARRQQEKQDEEARRQQEKQDEEAKRQQKKQDEEARR